jgi:hypothetical protein
MLSVLRITANKTHPTRSLTIAEPKIVCPTFVRSRLRSIKILATNGIAEIDKAVPIKRLKRSLRSGATR